MHGNAGQWCADCLGEDYYAKSPADDPTGSDAAGLVRRGGSWSDGPLDARSAFRSAYLPDHRDNSTGFRVARSQ